MKIAFLSLLLVSTEALATQAQPVPVPEDQSLTPQIEIAGVGAATLAISRGRNSGNPVQSGMNLSDSSLVFGAAQRLAPASAIGSFGLGFLTLDDSNSGYGSQLFVHQAFLDYQSESVEILLGRSDQPNAHLVDFPTLRGDDLITLLNPLNPFSNGANPEEHRYSNVASITFNQGLKVYENLHAQYLIHSAGTGSDFRINSLGANIQVLSDPGMEAFSRLPSFGIGYEYLLLRSQTADGLHQFLAGGTFNLNESVTQRVELRVQEILSLGSSLNATSTLPETYQANSNSIAASLRYLSNPFGTLGHQLSLTTAFKHYLQMNHHRSAGLILTGVKRLGMGFDAVLQYSGQWRDSPLAQIQSQSIPFEQSLELGFVFNFDAIINPHLVPRRTLLNQKFQYLPN